MAETFAYSFMATELDARAGIAEIVTRLRDFGLPELRVHEVQIALAEAVNNVVEHAYAGSATGDVRIRCTLEPQRLWINISDAGAPFPDGQLPDGKPVDIDVPIEQMPEGGFGWFLIRELTSDIHYESHEGNNELSLCFEIQVTRAGSA